METISSQNISNLSHHNQVAFALFCAKQVIHLVEPKRKEVADKCIEVVHLWFEGKATKEDCASAYAAAYAYAATAAANAAYTAYTAAANAAYTAYTAAAYAASSAAYAAASSAAYAADKETIIKAQWDYYNELLELDNYLVEIVLEEKVV